MTDAPADQAFYEADSHIMELPDFRRDHADPAIREQIRKVSYVASLVTDEEVDLIVANENRHNFDAADFLRILPDARVH